MTTLREAAQQALEVLDAPSGTVSIDQWVDMCSALRAALAEPTGKDDLQVEPQDEPVAWMFEDDEDDGHKSFRQTPPSPESVAYLAKWNRPAWTPLYTHPAPQRQPQEPVAWIQPDHLEKARRAPFLCRVEPTQRIADFVPLCTAPQRQRLSGHEIRRIVEETVKAATPHEHVVFHEVVRAIERAHGIGGQDE